MVLRKYKSNIFKNSRIIIYKFCEAVVIYKQYKVIIEEHSENAQKYLENCVDKMFCGTKIYLLSCWNINKHAVTVSRTYIVRV